MYACHSDALPGYVWTSTSDATDFLPGWKCVKLAEPLPGSTVSGWFTGWKVARLIEQFHF